MQRASVLGNSGSGKTRLVAELALILGVPHVELDAVHHLPDWEPIDPDEFVGALAATDGVESPARCECRDGAGGACRTSRFAPRGQPCGSVGAVVVVGRFASQETVREGDAVDRGGHVVFDDFYRAEFAGFVALAAAVTGSWVAAEDVAQEAMVDAHRRWDRLAGYASPGGWVRRVVVQRSIKVTRKGANERTAHLRAAPEPAGPAEAPDSELLAALRALPERQRAAVALHYLQDASVAETADVLGISAGSVKTHLSRARVALAAALDEPSRLEEDR